MGSKTHLLDKNHTKYQKTLINHIEVGKVSKLLFILDADENFKVTETAIKNRQEDLNIIIIADNLKMCNCETKKGYLESLILETLPDEHKKCIDSFLECSGSTKDDKHIVKSMYEQYYPDKGYNFEHESFNLLHDKLMQLFT
jgi:hypothetical protein